jgi:hypothetical protein
VSERLWCSCCGRRYSRSTSAEILRDLRAEYAARPVDENGHEGPWWFHSLYGVESRVVAELRASGYLTFGDLDAAGDKLLDVRWVGRERLPPRRHRLRDAVRQNGRAARLFLRAVRPATLAWIQRHLDDAWAALFHVNGVAAAPTSGVVPE